MPWYRVGSVEITAGQNTVTGTGTNFSTNARVGDAFQGPDGRWYEVTNIASATVLSILPAYQGATVSAGAYGLAPMQGYVKTSADRLKQLVDQWGSALASLGAVSTENVVPVAKGGTGGTTQALARNGLGLKTAAIADILGAVSQSGGAPTGAILERGSNANGEYVKYADGTQICWMARTDNVAIDQSSTGVFYSTSSGWTYPVSFSSTPAVLGNGRRASGITWVVVGSPSASSVLYNHVAAQSQGSLGASIALVAIGRWYQ